MKFQKYGKIFFKYLGRDIGCGLADRDDLQAKRFRKGTWTVKAFKRIQKIDCTKSTKEYLRDNIATANVRTLCYSYNTGTDHN